MPTVPVHWSSYLFLPLVGAVLTICLMLIFPAKFFQETELDPKSKEGEKCSHCGLNPWIIVSIGTGVMVILAIIQFFRYRKHSKLGKIATVGQSKKHWMRWFIPPLLGLFITPAILLLFQPDIIRTNDPEGEVRCTSCGVSRVTILIISLIVLVIVAFIQYIRYQSSAPEVQQEARQEARQEAPLSHSERAAALKREIELKSLERQLRQLRMEEFGKNVKRKC